MAEDKTTNNLTIITSKPMTVFIIAFIISLVFSNLFLLLFLFFQFSFDVHVFFVGLTIFLVSLASILLIKTECLMGIKNNYKRKPPLQILFLFIPSYFFLLWILPDTIMGQAKISPAVLVFLVIPNAAFTIILSTIYYYIFMKLMSLMTELRSREILTESDFLEKLNFKTKEIQRYGGTFSLILITFIVPKFAVNKLKQSMVFSLFYELVRSYIRNTDILGICGNGNIAAVLSNNNNIKKAQTQEHRIVDTLKKNSLFMKKIEVYNAEFTTTSREYSREIITGQDMFEYAIEKITAEQSLYWNRFSGKGLKE